MWSVCEGGGACQGKPLLPYEATRQELTVAMSPFSLLLPSGRPSASVSGCPDPPILPPPSTQALRERIGLGSWGDKFVVGVVSRLTGQKGVGLIKHAAHRTVERGGQFVLLGSAPDPKVQVGVGGGREGGGHGDQQAWSGATSLYCWAWRPTPKCR